jgi:hypothetical protein
MPRRTLALVTLAAAAALLAGCATGTGSPGASSPAPSATAASEIGAAWLGGGETVGLVTFGSSSTACIPTAASTTYASGILTVELAGPPANTACTMDYTARATPVAVPAGVDSSKDVRVVVTGAVQGETVLAGVASMPPGGSSYEGVPTAGWTTLPNTLVLLTYGSSTCLPQISDAKVSSPGKITVTEAALPANTPCTADMVPQTTVVEVPGVTSGTAYTMVLLTAGGGSFEVPVSGTAP